MWLSNVQWRDDLFGPRFLMKLPVSLPDNTDEQYAADELKRLLENAKQCWEVHGTKRRSDGPPYGQPPAEQHQLGQQQKQRVQQQPSRPRLECAGHKRMSIAEFLDVNPHLRATPDQKHDFPPWVRDLFMERNVCMMCFEPYHRPLSCLAPKSERDAVSARISGVKATAKAERERAGSYLQQGLQAAMREVPARGGFAPQYGRGPPQGRGRGGPVEGRGRADAQRGRGPQHFGGRGPAGGRGARGRGRGRGPDGRGAPDQQPPGPPGQ